MPLESLPLCGDSRVFRFCSKHWQQLSIDVEVCRGARSGSEIVLAEKFDAGIVDCDDLDQRLEQETLRVDPLPDVKRFSH